MLGRSLKGSIGRETAGKGLHMNRARPWGLTGLAGCALALAACNGSDSGSGTTAPTTASVVGLWSGTDAASGLSLDGIINAAGDMVVIRGDGSQFVGNLQVAGSQLAAAVDGYANFGGSFADTSDIYGIGTLSGTATTGQSISATVTFSTVATDTSVPGTWTLTPGGSTSVASSLANVTGSFSVISAGISAVPPVDSITITNTGAMSGQGSASGCVLAGTISVPDATLNEYAVTYTITSCTAGSNFAVLNGVTFSGLGFVNYANSPSVLVIAVHGTSTTNATNGIDFGIVSNLTPV